MIRAVIDTSSLVSYVLTRGELMRRVVEHWQAGTFSNATRGTTAFEAAETLWQMLETHKAET